MKKLIIVSTMLFFLSENSFAKIWRVNNMSGVTADFTTAQAAHEKAKEMHKQEIIRAFIDGEENVWDRKEEGHGFQYDNHEHYYTETFKK